MDKALIQKVYSQGATQYDSLMAGEWDPTTPRGEVIESLGLQPGQSLLDVCIGTGLNFPHYPEGVEVTGIDFTEAMLAVARGKTAEGGPKVKLMLMDATKMDFPDASFDSVLATYALSVVPDPLRVLGEMVRVCRPGGRLGIWDSTLSDLPEVASKQEEINRTSSSVGIPEGLIVFNVAVDFADLVGNLPGVRIERFTRYDRSDPMKSRCLIILTKV